MSQELAAPRLYMPKSLEADWQQHNLLQNMYGQLQSTSLEEYCQTLLPIQNFNAANTLHYVDYLPPDADESHAIIVPHPFRAGLPAHMQARLQMISAAAGRPTRVISLPNGSANAPTISLQKNELRQISCGNFNPYTDRLCRTIERFKEVASVDIIGYSQGGAMTAASLAKLANSIEIRSAGVLDPPNMKAQRFVSLMRRFAATGPGSVPKAVAATGIAWLGESIADGELATLPGKIRYAHSSLTGVNGALARGMAKHGNKEDLHAACVLGIPLTLMRAERSLVTPAEPFHNTVAGLQGRFPGLVQSFEVEGYGHEAGEHIVVHGIMASRVLRHARSVRHNVHLNQ